jgi:NAD(P)H-dependent flavin oxidoreductase YrpB (nitropropane dioxygenase family)
MVVGAGGICDGRGLASALAAGCSGVWVGTRFIASDEAGAGPMHKQRVVEADYGDTIRTIIYSGRPMRVFRTPYNVEYEETRQNEIKEMQAAGLPAWVKDVDPEVFVGANPASVGTLNLSPRLSMEEKEKGVVLSKHEEHHRAVFLTGECAAAIKDIKPAKDIIDEMVGQAAEQLQVASSFVTSRL